MTNAVVTVPAVQSGNTRVSCAASIASRHMRSGKQTMPSPAIAKAVSTVDSFATIAGRGFGLVYDFLAIATMDFFFPRRTCLRWAC